MTEDTREVSYRRRLLKILNMTTSMMNDVEFLGTDITDEDLRKLDYVIETLNKVDVKIELPF